MLIPEIIVILKLLLRKDLEQFKVYWVGIGERLDGGERSKVVEIEVCVRKEGGLQGAERDGLGFLGGNFFGFLRIESAKSLEDVLVGLPKDVKTVTLLP